MPTVVQAPTVESNHSHEHSEKPTILVVDDSRTDRRFIRAILDQHGCWNSVFAANGKEALAVMEQSQVSIVLTDVQMPEMDGMELTRELRQAHPHVPVVLMTGTCSEHVAVQMLEMGAVNFVSKRNLAHELIAILDRVLTAAERDRRRRQIHNSVTQYEVHYCLANDVKLVPSLIGLIQEQVAGMLDLDEISNTRVGIALEEGLLNAICHGNLEVSSDLRRLDGDECFQALLGQRRCELPYSDRQVFVRLRVNREKAECKIRDEGPGFNPTALPDPTDPANLEKPSGRGLLLIRAFMDEVSHNQTGNEITLVKRRGTKKRTVRK